MGDDFDNEAGLSANASASLDACRPLGPLKRDLVAGLEKGPRR